jgi:hypothetical protein
MATLQIHGDTTAAGPLLGLRLDLLADSSRTSPRLVVEAALGRLSVSLGGEASSQPLPTVPAYSPRARANRALPVPPLGKARDKSSPYVNPYSFR